MVLFDYFFFFVKQKTAYEMRISDWSSDVCSSDLNTYLAPFQHAIDIRVPAIMVGHIDVRAVDPGTPSSLSMKVITGLLRQRMGFDGLVITDALDMAAV